METETLLADVQRMLAQVAVPPADPFASMAAATEASKDAGIPEVKDPATAAACAELATIDQQLADLKQKRDMKAADLREAAERKRVELSQRSGFVGAIRYNGLKYISKFQYSPVALKSKPTLQALFGAKYATYFTEGYEVTIKPEAVEKLTVEQRTTLAAMGAIVKAVIKPTLAYHEGRTMDANVISQQVKLADVVKQFTPSIGGA